MKYEIEKNIPMITDGRRKYPWREMEIGDSFLCKLTAEIFIEAPNSAGLKYPPEKKAINTGFGALPNA